MKPPCEYTVRYVLPTFRSLVAKKLVEEYNYSQVTAAEKLGITQAAISQYLYSKRGTKKMKEIEIMPQVQTFVNEYVENIVNGQSPYINDMPLFCELCKTLRRNNAF